MHTAGVGKIPTVRVVKEKSATHAGSLYADPVTVVTCRLAVSRVAGRAASPAARGTHHPRARSTLPTGRRPTRETSVHGPDECPRSRRPVADSQSHSAHTRLTPHPCPHPPCGARPRHPHPHRPGPAPDPHPLALARCLTCDSSEQNGVRRRTASSPLLQVSTLSSRYQGAHSTRVGAHVPSGSSEVTLPTTAACS